MAVSNEGLRIEVGDVVLLWEPGGNYEAEVLAFGQTKYGTFLLKVKRLKGWFRREEWVPTDYHFEAVVLSIKKGPPDPGRNP